MALFAAPAAAMPFESFVSIEDDDDLADLYAAGVLSEESYDQLLDLLARGVDLNNATRDELYELPNLTLEDVDRLLTYRATAGQIHELAELVVAGVLTRQKAIAIAAFAVASRRDQTLLRSGWLATQARWTVHDRLAPPLMMRARAVTNSGWTVGLLAGHSRLRVGEPVWDAERKVLEVAGHESRAELGKLYARYDGASLDAIAGSYRIGLGQRLIFDNTVRYQPDGIAIDDQFYYVSDLSLACTETAGDLAASPCADQGRVYTTPDYRWRTGLLGGAVDVRTRLGKGNGRAVAWGSYHGKDIYQYELVDRASCPLGSDDATCSSPPVRAPGDATHGYAYETLPNVFREALAGGYLAYEHSDRDRIGIMGYGAMRQALVGGVALDTKASSRSPSGGHFGAIGLTGAVALGPWDGYAEVAAGYAEVAAGFAPDAQLGASVGERMGGIVRAVRSSDVHDLELSARYYGSRFVNPYARALSAADEANGQRVSDEAGARVRYQQNRRHLDLRLVGDAWVVPSTQVVKVDLFGNLAWRFRDAWRMAWWVRYRDKGVGDPNTCYEELGDAEGEDREVLVDGCAGRRVSSALAVSSDAGRMISGGLVVQPAIVDASELPGGRRYDVNAWVHVGLRPSRKVRFRSALRLHKEDLRSMAEGTASLLSRNDVTLGFRRRDAVRLRLDIRAYDDQQAVARRPAPELTGWLTYQVHY